MCVSRMKFMSSKGHAILYYFVNFVKASQRMQGKEKKLASSVRNKKERALRMTSVEETHERS